MYLENEELKSFKLKILSWKVQHEIGKNEVEKFGLKLEGLGLSSMVNRKLERT